MLDKQPIRPICEKCGKLPARKNGLSARGFQRWHKYCNTCAKHKYEHKIKDDHCDECGFKCADMCQMCSVDGKTLCLNCNALRLKNNRQGELTVDATVDWGNLRL